MADLQRAIFGFLKTHQSYEQTFLFPSKKLQRCLAAILHRSAPQRIRLIDDGVSQQLLHFIRIRTLFQIYQHLQTCSSP
ncbi:hypothetical protein D3C73_593720 [compost metagenome]